VAVLNQAERCFCNQKKGKRKRKKNRATEERRHLNPNGGKKTAFILTNRRNPFAIDRAHWGEHIEGEKRKREEKNHWVYTEEENSCDHSKRKRNAVLRLEKRKPNGKEKRKHCMKKRGSRT